MKQLPLQGLDMPFGLLALDGSKGKCASFETGSAPMLLSLYAQCTLGTQGFGTWCLFSEEQ